MRFVGLVPTLMAKKSERGTEAVSLDLKVDRLKTARKKTLTGYFAHGDPRFVSPET